MMLCVQLQLTYTYQIGNIFLKSSFLYQRQTCSFPHYVQCIEPDCSDDNHKSPAPSQHARLTVHHLKSERMCQTRPGHYPSKKDNILSIFAC